MNDYFDVLNFQIPNELKSLCESISEEEGNEVQDGARAGAESKEQSAHY